MSKSVVSPVQDEYSSAKRGSYTSGGSKIGQDKSAVKAPKRSMSTMPVVDEVSIKKAKIIDKWKGQGKWPTKEYY